MREMATLKLKVSKVSNVNPKTKQKGITARVLTNGTADFSVIAKEAGRNTTMHKAELRMAFELCIDSVADMLKQGYIVDLGPIGKLYPSCTSGWYEKEEDIKLSDVKPSLYYRAGEDVEAAIRGAKLVWAKAEEEEETPDGGTTPDTPDTPDTPGADTPDTPGGNDNPGGGDTPGGNDDPNNSED